MWPGLSPGVCNHPKHLKERIAQLRLTPGGGPPDPPRESSWPQSPSVCTGTPWKSSEPTCLPPTVKPQVLDMPSLLPLRMGQGPRESALMDKPKKRLWTPSSWELDVTLICWSVHTFFFF